MRIGIFALLGALTAACAAPTAGAKLQEASSELNLNARFGRMEMAIERVAAAEREEWLRRHKSWGGKIRVADAEMAGSRIVSDSEAEVTVKVAWFRLEEQELRVTTIRQKWKDVKGDWQLVGETKIDGDAGLLGEPPDPVAAPPAGAPAKAKAQFPTIRIGKPEDEPPYAP